MDPRPYHYEYRRPRLNNPTYQSTNLYETLYHREVLNRYQAANNISVYQPQHSQRQDYQNPIQKGHKNREYVEKYTSALIQKKQVLNDKLTNSVKLDSQNPEFVRPSSNRSNQSNYQNAKQQKPSILASYGRSSMIEQQRPYSDDKYYNQTKRSNQGAYDRINQFSVYKKQQKPYNIIGNFPRETSTELKKYPKLSLENKLIEEGRYNPLDSTSIF